jgi:uncharacterized protein YjaZ
MATQIEKVKPMSRMTRTELYEKCKIQHEEIQKLNLFQGEDKNEHIGLKYEKLQILNNEIWTECCERGEEIDRLNLILEKRVNLTIAMNNNIGLFLKNHKEILEEGGTVDITD